jgi:conjugative transfer signal peptidase TraF
MVEQEWCAETELMSARGKGSDTTASLAPDEAFRVEKKRNALLGRHIAIIGAGMGILLWSTAWPHAPRWVWNVSASAPIGLYAVAPAASAGPGDVVIAWVPQRHRRLAAERRYVPLNVPLVKRVVAHAGDQVCARGPDIFVNGRRLAERHRTDGKGRPMPMWKGCTLLRDRQLFLLMDDPASFDGRYFGFTEGSDVIGKARLLWHP